MADVFHIHAVLDMIHASAAPLSKVALMEQIDKQFGENALFTSCSDQVFGKGDIIPFLQSRNKISMEGEYIHLLSPSCNH